MNFEITRSLMLIVLILLTCIGVPAEQEVDSFYLNLLDKGEQCFLDGDYEGAVKNLKIAYFGIRAKDEIKAKACVYLGLSHYYLKQTGEGRKYLQEADEILGPHGINALEIDQGAKLDLIRLTKAVESGRPVKAGGLQRMPRVPAERATKNMYQNKEEIEHLIKANPSNASLYYDLYSFHRFHNNFKEGKKALKKLVDNIPRDSFGYYMLGIILYQEKEFKDAASHLVTFLQRAATQDIRNEIQTEIRALLILSRYYQGDRKEARILIEESREWLEISTIHTLLHLSDKDKIVLRGLLENPE